MTATAISTALGGQKTLRRRIDSDGELREITRVGVPVGTLSVLAADLGIERSAIARAIGISERTLNRRIAAASLLNAEESDRTVRFARVVALATETLGTVDKASHWLRTPNVTLEDERPLDLMDTDVGVRSVETILGRIEYGLYS